MAKLSIRTTDLENGDVNTIETNGAVLLYMEGDKLKILGKIDLAELAPLLTKIALEKLLK